MNGLQAADYVIIAGFFAVMLGIGSYYGSRMKSAAQFFGGGKQVPWWLGGVSFYMVSFSALAFVMHSELVYKYGLVSLVLSWLSVPAAVCSAVLFARRWRKVADASPLEYVEQRYGAGMRQGFVWLGLPARLLDDSLKLFAIGTVVSAGLGFPFETGVIACAAIILCYTFMGGLFAALAADFVQFVVLVAAIVLLPVLAFRKAGGIGVVLDALPANFLEPSVPEYPVSYLFCYFILLFLNYSSSWALAQRYYSAKDDRSAVKTGLLVAGLYLIGTPFFYAGAFAARSFLPEITNTKDVFPLLCRSVLPVGMLGMVVAAMFSATMSTLAGDYNAVSSVITNDFYARFLRRNADSKHLLAVGRLTTLLVGLSVLGIVFVMRSLQGANDLFAIMAKIFGLFLPPVAIPMLLGMLTPKVSSVGGRLSLVGGVLGGLTLFVLGFRTAQALTFSTTAIALTAAAVGSYAWPDRGARREAVEQFFAKIRQKSIVQSTEAVQTETTGFVPVITVAIGTIGVILVVSIWSLSGWQQGEMGILTGAALIISAAVAEFSRRLKRRFSCR